MKKSVLLKRYRWYILIAFALLFCLASLNIPSSTAQHEGLMIDIQKADDLITVDSAFSKPLVKPYTLEGYSRVEMSGLRMRSIPGEPVIPFYTVKLAVPAGKEFAGVEVTPGQKIFLGNHMIEPSAVPVPISWEEEPATIEPDEKIYLSANPYPDRLISEPLIQSKSGVPILVVNIYPLEYIPSEGKVSYYETITLDFNFTELAIETAAVSKFSPSELERNLIGQMIVNPSDLDGYSVASVETETTSAGQLGSEEAFEYIIITNEAFEKSFQVLADWREEQGLRSKVVTVEYIYANYSGRDRPEKIRNYIIDAKQRHGVSFVLLGGDADGDDSSGNIIPARDLWRPVTARLTDPSAIPADHYYAALEGCFDYNNNNVFGEEGDGPEGSEIDLLADVYVGRAPVSTITEAGNFVLKQIAYDSAADDPYLKEVWMIGELLDKASPCATKSALETRELVESESLLSTLYRFRDQIIKQEYVKMYYRNDSLLRETMLSKPGLLYSAGGILIKYGSLLEEYINTGDSSYSITREDIKELESFISTLKTAVKAGSEEFDSTREELIAELKLLLEYLKTLEGKEFGVAVETSPYIKEERTADLGVPRKMSSSYTWGGDYKDEIKYGSSNHGYTTAGFPASFNVNTLYDRDLYPEEWSIGDISEILNEGPHIINHMGHAKTCEAMKMTIDDVKALDNNRLFFVYSQGCYTASFDNKTSIQNEYHSDDSIAEHFVTGEAGAFAYIGNSRYGWYLPQSTDGISQRFDRYFWHYMFTSDHDQTYLGVANHYSKTQNIAYVGNCPHTRFTYYGLNLLGCPATLLQMPEGKIEVNFIDLPASVRTNDELTLKAQLINRSSTVKEDIEVKFFVEDTLLSILTVPKLEAGKTKSVEATWIATEPGNYSLKAIAGNAIAEKQISVEASLIVDDDLKDYPDADYTCISEAINAALPGDTIWVYPGNYDSFTIDKELNILGIDNPRVDGGGSRNGIVIEAESRLEGFTVTNCRQGTQSSPGYAILVNVSNSVLTGNNISGNNGVGIALNAVSNVKVARNLIMKNQVGLAIHEDCRNLEINGNVIELNDTGIRFTSGDGTDETVDYGFVSLPVMFFGNNFANSKEVDDEPEINDFIKWYHPQWLTGNYWSQAAHENDIYSLEMRTPQLRISGLNRYATAEAISNEGWQSADTVILARGDGFADALAGVPLAEHYNAPILLSGQNELKESTWSEIDRLGAKQIIILGGEAVISESVAFKLRQSGLDVERIAGSDRNETAALVAIRLANEMGSGVDTAVIVYGHNFPDAISVTAYAASKGYPILLTDTYNTSEHTLEALNYLGIENVYVVGGPAVISDNVIKNLPVTGSIERVYGANRYETALALAEYFLVDDAKHLYLGTGLDFPDTVTGAVLAAKHNSGVLLVKGTSGELPTNLENFIEDRGISRVTIFGGSNAVNSELERQLNKIIY